MLISKVNGDLTIAHQYLARILENTGEQVQALGRSARFRDAAENLTSVEPLLLVLGLTVPARLECAAGLGKVRLLPGQHTEVQVHGGDESLYVLDGTVNVRLRDVDGRL